MLHVYHSLSKVTYGNIIVLSFMTPLDLLQRVLRVQRDGDAAAREAPQKCTSKGIRRQGVVSKHRSSLEKSLCPAVVCPYLCSSEAPREGGVPRVHADQPARGAGPLRSLLQQM